MGSPTGASMSGAIAGPPPETCTAVHQTRPLLKDLGGVLLNRHQVGGVSRSPDGLFVQQEGEPTRGRSAMRGKGTCGGRSGQCMEEQGAWASRTRKRREAGYGQPVDTGVWTAKTVKRPRQQPAQPNTPTTGHR